MGDNIDRKCDAKKVILEEQYVILNNLIEELTKLVSDYRLLVGAADELNKIALATKSDVKKAIKRANNLGKIIDQIINIIEKVNCVYIAYAEIHTKTIPLDKLLESVAVQQLIEIGEDIKK